MITMHTWMAALALASFLYAATHILRKGLPLLAPIAGLIVHEMYHSRYSAHRKGKARSYTSQEVVDLDQSNFSVPENWVEEMPDERTWSQITASYDRSDLAVYERSQYTGELEPLPFDTSEIPAYVPSDESWPRSSVRVFWEARDTQPDSILDTDAWNSERPPYPTNPEVDPFAYDGRRWAATQILEPVG